MKKPWQTPELIVLVRNKPEEAVLTACKMPQGENNPYLSATGCDDDCEPCSIFGAS